MYANVSIYVYEYYCEGVKICGCVDFIMYVYSYTSVFSYQFILDYLYLYKYS